MPQARPVSIARHAVLADGETRDLMALCQDNRVSLSTAVSAAILLAEWQIQETPSIPIPYVSPEDLRCLLSPPVAATASTNPLGVAAYLAEIDSDTDIVELAGDIAQNFGKTCRRVSSSSLSPLQSAGCRRSTRPSRCRDVHGWRTGADDAHSRQPGDRRRPWRDVADRIDGSRHLLHRYLSSTGCGSSITRMPPQAGERSKP